MLKGLLNVIILLINNQVSCPHLAEVKHIRRFAKATSIEDYAKIQAENDKEIREIAIDRILNDKVEKDYENIIDGFPPEEDFNPSKPDKLLLYCNSYERLQEFSDFVDKHNNLFTPKEYWYGLRGAYQDSDNLYRAKEAILNLFTASIVNREYLMTPDEREYLNKLPDSVTIYRGMTELESKIGEKDASQYGVSWTLSKEKAEFFAYEYGRNPDTQELEKTVVEKIVSKENIIAYFDGREEQEVIFLFS